MRVLVLSGCLAASVLWAGCGDDGGSREPVDAADTLEDLTDAAPPEEISPGSDSLPAEDTQQSDALLPADTQESDTTQGIDAQDTALEDTTPGPVCTQPCLNGGLCVADDTCDCGVTGYEGAHCQDAICEEPCLNGGFCSEPGVCDCGDTDFGGPRCASLVCGGVACPELEGFNAYCNEKSHCEYALDDKAHPWQADILWIWVPPGSFTMGAGALDAFASPNERPTADITFTRGYFIAKLPVTVRLHEACESAEVCEAPSASEWNASGWGLNRSSNDRALHPQNGLPRDRLVDACAWLGGRLPSEAEWAYAARGPESLLYPWGNSPAPECDVHAVFRTSGPGTIVDNYGCATGGTMAVGPDVRTAGASPVGCLDMVGNVAEAVSDCYASGFDGVPADGSPRVEGCANEMAVIRGAGFIGGADWMRVSKRNESGAGYLAAFVGGRCVRDFVE